ncbi:putative integral membrane protein [Thiovulum sp. ES]|nr:putative integral membrane protein [Thiovulum sp. ES]
MEKIVAEYGNIIIFLHIISAVIWVGGMIAVRIAVHPAMQMIATPELRISRSLNIMKNLFHLVIPFIIILLITGIILTIAMHRGEPLTHAKEGIWLVMLINFIVMYIRRGKADELSRLGKPENVAEAKKIATLLSNYMIPVNIALGIIAIYIGAMLHLG